LASSLQNASDGWRRETALHHRNDMSNPQIIEAPLAAISPIEIPQTHLAPHLEASTSRPILTVVGGVNTY